MTFEAARMMVPTILEPIRIAPVYSDGLAKAEVIGNAMHIGLYVIQRPIEIDGMPYEHHVNHRHIIPIEGVIAALPPIMRLLSTSQIGTIAARAMRIFQ